MRFYAEPLNTVAHYWRIYRRDGVALGFVTHDRDLAFGPLKHRAAPGLVPSAIRLSSDLRDDDAAVEGVLAHATISEQDLAAGRYDGAAIEIGLVDWESLDHHALYHGIIHSVTREGARFSADLLSAKSSLEHDPIPRTGPSCRAEFCGPGCDLNPRRFEHRAALGAIERHRYTVAVDDPRGEALTCGTLRLVDGPQAGETFHILAVDAGRLTLDRPLAVGTEAGCRAILREGCDRTIASCATRFDNAINFRGEPFLPGADLLAQYPVAR